MAVLFSSHTLGLSSGFVALARKSQRHFVDLPQRLGEDALHRGEGDADLDRQLIRQVLQDRRGSIVRQDRRPEPDHPRVLALQEREQLLRLYPFEKREWLE